MGAVTFHPLAVAHVAAIDLQPSQRIEIGVPWRPSAETAALYVGAGEGFAAIDAGGRVVAIAGLAEEFAGVQALLWACLSADLGTRAHLAITRFGKAWLAASTLRRIHAMVPDDARCRAWARLAGLGHRAALPCWGPSGETIHLYDRVEPSA